MRLENVLALTDGTLIYEPYVKEFGSIVFDAKRVKRGDLFIAFDEQGVEEALLNGAYGILFDKATQINDYEIAWIKVQNIEDALTRLLRFRLIEKDLHVYECDEIILKLALQVLTQENFITLNGDIKTIFKRLWDVEDSSTILFSPTLIKSEIFTNIKKIPKNTFEKIDIIEQTLFETSFIYDNVFYERQFLSPFFMPYLEELLSLFKTLKITFRLKKFMQLEHFEAVFTNKKFEIKEFGTSDKVLIFEKNRFLIQKEIEYLTKEATWGTTIFVLPSNLHLNIEKNVNIVTYQNKNEIIKILKTHQFHFALIVGVDKNILFKPITLDNRDSLFHYHY